MRRFVATSLLISAVLLAAEVSFAQDKQPAAAGAKADSPDMWAAYKKMWEGEWEATITFPADLDNGPKKGDTFTTTMTNEVVALGCGMLITRVIRDPSGAVVMEQKGLANWCPKQEVTVLHELNSAGGCGDSVIKMVDGEEHSTVSFMDADGKESNFRTTATVIDQDTNKIKIVDGPLKGFEITYKRTKK